jgi:hypothetical protein
MKEAAISTSANLYDSNNNNNIVNLNEEKLSSIKLKLPNINENKLKNLEARFLGPSSNGNLPYEFDLIPDLNYEFMKSSK